MGRTIDELTAKLNSCSDNSERITILSDLLKEYSFVSDSDRILACGTELLTLSRAEKDAAHESAALIALGSHAKDENQYELALSRLSTALSLAKESGNIEDIMSALTNIGSVYYALARYDKVLELCFDKVVSGGYIIYDDYLVPESQVAIHEFTQKNGIEISNSNGVYFSIRG